MRKHFKALLGFKTYKQLAGRHPPLTDEEIEGYGFDTNGVVCTVAKFRIDFIHSWKDLAMNQDARHIFIEHFLSVAQGGAFPFSSEESTRVTYETVR